MGISKVVGGQVSEGARVGGGGAGSVKGRVSEHAIESQCGLSPSDDTGDSEINRDENIIKTSFLGAYLQTCSTRLMTSGRD